jgi:hypothetical protein
MAGKMPAPRGGRPYAGLESTSRALKTLFSAAIAILNSSQQKTPKPAASGLVGMQWLRNLPAPMACQWQA